MRRRYIPILLALRSADALSLANFQQITAILLPNACLSAYNAQILSCTQTDFEQQCSLSCQLGLNQVAKNVQSGCSNIIVNSNALLGIVIAGGIIPALCPAVERATTTTIAKTTTPVAASSAEVSVTIPTGSPGVTGGGGRTSSAATSQVQVTIPTTRSSTAEARTSTPEASSTPEVSSTLQVSSTPETSSTAESTTAVSSVISTPPTSTQVVSVATTTTPILITATSKQGTVASTSETDAAASTKAAPKNDGGGGGSPFDISSNSANGVGCSILGVLGAVAWAGVLLVW